MSSQQIKYEDLVKAIAEVLPEASFGEDNDGQLVIYTNMTEVRTADGQWVLEHFEPFDAMG